MQAAPVTFRWIDAADPLMAEVDAVRHEALFAPFGLPRLDGWDDDGAALRHVAALEGGRVVAYACLILEADGSGHVRQVSVRPERHGAGIGRALMLEVEAEARRLELPLLWLNARCTAEPFYHRVGYETVSGVFPSGRTGVDHVRMERPLG
jgi:GNAT superfamily N-acetyltransferase